MPDGSQDWFLVAWCRYTMPDLDGFTAFSKVIIMDRSKIVDLPGKLFFFFLNKTRVKILQCFCFEYIFLKIIQLFMSCRLLKC